MDLYLRLSIKASGIRTCDASTQPEDAVRCVTTKVHLNAPVAIIIALDLVRKKPGYEPVTSFFAALSITKHE